MGKKVIIIGTGFSSLSSACFLAKAGYQVSLIEKNDSCGGRARKFSDSGFTFDMGPSWYWMPDVFERFFSSFGKKVSDYYDLKRLDPSYRVFWEEGDYTDIPAEYSELQTLFDKHEKEGGKKLNYFLKEAAFKYKVGMNRLVYKPSKSITEFIDWDVIKGLFRLQLFQPLSKHVKKLFTNKRLIKILEFPVLFLGAKPEETPALYSLMNYADLKLGTWYPKGGMHKIIEGMQSLAVELGVEIRTNQEVKSINVENSKVISISTETEEIKGDIFVSGADYRHTETLLNEKYRNYSAKYWEGRKLAPSALIFYLGLNKKIAKLEHHNLFFDEEFDLHATEIYDEPKWPSKPLFYICASSRSDHTVCPEGKENIFILMPVAPNLEDNEETRDRYYNLIMKRIEEKLGEEVKNHVIFKRSYAHQNFEEDYHAYKGNAYGLANTLRQTAILKPSIRNKKLKNLFYTGQLTTPGPGVPPSIISGEVVANEIVKG